MRKRINVDRNIIWLNIETNHKMVPLEGRDLNLEMKDPLGYVQMMDIEIVDQYCISFRWPAINQKTLGDYSLTLWENYGKAGQTALDKVRCITLVATTDEEDDEGENSLDVKANVVLRGGNIVTSVGGGGSTPSGPSTPEKIIFDYNLVLTADIGVQKLDGQPSKTLQTQGKNLKEVLNMIVAEDKEPTVTAPSCAISLKGAGTYEVGTVMNADNLTYTAQLNPGKYQYGPATGITAKIWAVEDTMGHKGAAATGHLMETLTVDDTTNYIVKAKANYDAAEAIPQTTLGNPCPTKKIPGGTTPQVQSAAIKGCRYFYSGPKTEKVAPEQINAAYMKGMTHHTTRNFEIVVPAGAQRVYIGYPSGKGYNLTEALDGGDNWNNIAGSFKQNTKQEMIGGVGDYKPIAYDIFWKNFAYPMDKQFVIKIKI